MGDVLPQFLRMRITMQISHRDGGLKAFVSGGDSAMARIGVRSGPSPVFQQRGRGRFVWAAEYTSPNAIISARPSVARTLEGNPSGRCGIGIPCDWRVVNPRQSHRVYGVSQGRLDCYIPKPKGIW